MIAAKREGLFSRIIPECLQLFPATGKNPFAKGPIIGRCRRWFRNGSRLWGGLKDLLAQRCRNVDTKGQLTSRQGGQFTPLGNVEKKRPRFHLSRSVPYNNGPKLVVTDQNRRHPVTKQPHITRASVLRVKQLGPAQLLDPYSLRDGKGFDKRRVPSAYGNQQFHPVTRFGGTMGERGHRRIPAGLFIRFRCPRDQGVP